MWNWVSEMAKPCGRVVSAWKPTTRSRSSMLSTQAAVGMAEAIVDRRAVIVELRRSDHLRRIADVLAVDGAKLVDERALVLRLVGIWREPDVDEVLEAGELLEADLAAELVEARHAVLAVADDVERGEVDGGVEARAEIEVLEELRVVPEEEQPQPLAPHGQRPVGEAALLHRRRRLAAERVDDRHALRDGVGIGDVAELEHVGKERMEPVDRGELLGEVEGRAEMVGAAIDVVGIGEIPVVDRQPLGREGGIALAVAAADDAGAGGEGRVELVAPDRIVGFGKGGDDLLGRLGGERVVLEQARPVGVHAEIERLVIEELRRPLDGVDLGDLGGDDQARDLEQLLVADLGPGDRLGQARKDCGGRSRRPGARAPSRGTRRRWRCARGRRRCGRSSCRPTRSRRRRPTPAPPTPAGSARNRHRRAAPGGHGAAKTGR